MHVPGGMVVAVLGVLICAALLTQIEYHKSLILLAAVVIAFVNWLVVRKRKAPGRTRPGLQGSS